MLFLHFVRRDPRHYQIAVLALLLGYGVLVLDFDVDATRVGLILGVALLVQWAGSRVCRLPGGFDPRSALISALSLCLLLRTNSGGLAAAGAAVAVGSKFALRWRGKHLFNPTNFALVTLLALAGGRAWVSPAQWGSAAFFGFLLLCVGGMVTRRAARADVALAFLAGYLGWVCLRSAWLGEPGTIPLHRLQSGALLLFTFFMISDPRTTPDSRAGRVVFGLLVATGAAFVQFRLFRTNGLLWSLAACSLLTPLLDLLLPGRRYRWDAPGGQPGGTDAADAPTRRPAAVGGPTVQPIPAFARQLPPALSPVATTINPPVPAYHATVLS